MHQDGGLHLGVQEAVQETDHQALEGNIFYMSSLKSRNQQMGMGTLVILDNKHKMNSDVLHFHVSVSDFQTNFLTSSHSYKDVTK